VEPGPSVGARPPETDIATFSFVTVMAIKVPLRIVPPEEVKTFRNQYTDSLTNMFVEAVRVHNNFCTYQRWVSTDYTGPFSELKSGFLAYTN
jgi:hypothetical protein